MRKIIWKKASCMNPHPESLPELRWKFRCFWLEANGARCLLKGINLVCFPFIFANRHFCQKYSPLSKLSINKTSADYTYLKCFVVYFLAACVCKVPDTAVDIGLYPQLLHWSWIDRIRSLQKQANQNETAN